MLLLSSTLEFCNRTQLKAQRLLQSGHDLMTLISVFRSGGLETALADSRVLTRRDASCMFYQSSYHHHKVNGSICKFQRLELEWGADNSSISIRPLLGRGGYCVTCKRGEGPLNCGFTVGCQSQSQSQSYLIRTDRHYRSTESPTNPVRSGVNSRDKCWIHVT
jgi:hypothetical protein